MKLDRSASGARKLGLKAAKHGTWIALSLWTGFTFVGYFTPIRALAGEALALSFGPWEWWWIGLLFVRHLRQRRLDARAGVQVHVPLRALPERHVRPRHARDHLRPGAGRAARRARSRSADAKALGLGDCVDCGICVQVCPTGIDIRKGLQYECIGCAACIDGCDQVMRKMNYPTGLIRYSTENALEKHWGAREILRQVTRPRVLVYSAILAAIVVAAGTTLWLRSPHQDGRDPRPGEPRARDRRPAHRERLPASHHEHRRARAPLHALRGRLVPPRARRALHRHGRALPRDRAGHRRAMWPCACRRCPTTRKAPSPSSSS